MCSARNVELVRGLGADEVIDYTRQDFTRTGQSYDLILDNVANYPLSRLRRALAPNGTLIPKQWDVRTGPVNRRVADADSDRRAWQALEVERQRVARELYNIIAQSLSLRVLMLTSFDEDEYVHDAHASVGCGVGRTADAAARLGLVAATPALVGRPA